MARVQEALDFVAHYLGEPFPLAIALVLGAVAVSGKFSVVATQALLFVAWIVVLISLRHHVTFQIVGGGLIAAVVLCAVAVWFRPETVPLSFGTLIPNRSLLFSGSNKTTNTIIEIGDSGSTFVWGGPQGEPMFSFVNDASLVVERIKNVVKVSTTIKDDDGKILAELVRNEWRVAIHGIFDRNYTNDAVEVKDAKGMIVLQIHALPDRIRLQGIWRGPAGSFAALSKADGHRGGANLTFRSENGNPDVHPPIIKPMFKYPSDQHFGELAN